MGLKQGAMGIDYVYRVLKFCVWKKCDILVFNLLTSCCAEAENANRPYIFSRLRVLKSLSAVLNVWITYGLCTRGADKSLAPPTSRCRRTELIVSLDRGVCSCAELQVFSWGRKEACQATRAISITSRREMSSSSFFPARQGAEGSWRHSDRNIRGTCTIVCQRQTLGGPV